MQEAGKRARKRVRVYLPKHVRWLVLPLLAVVWAGLTVATFATAGRGSEDLMGWAIGTVVLGFVAVMIWLQTSGRLHAYELEIEEEETSR